MLCFEHDVYAKIIFKSHGNVYLINCPIELVKTPSHGVWVIRGNDRGGIEGYDVSDNVLGLIYKDNQVRLLCVEVEVEHSDITIVDLPHFIENGWELVML